MPIKLLQKQEINRLQAQEKSFAIEEGVKLAKRVDTLREIAAQEEASLASFRASTVKAIQEEIKKAENERDEAFRDAKNARDEIENSKKALAETETRLIQYESDLQNREIVLQKRTSALDTLAIKTEKTKKENDSINYKLKNTWAILTEYGKNVMHLYSEAKVVLQNALKQADSVQLLVVEVENELKTRDIAVASRERDVMIKEERIQQTVQDLRVKERQLHDRELTLERDIARLKKYESNSKN